jgi:hypothetical protein
VLIDRSCEKLIKDCDKVKLGSEGKVKPKVKDEDTGENYEELGHTSDAMEYLVSEIDICKDHIKKRKAA